MNKKKKIEIFDDEKYTKIPIMPVVGGIIERGDIIKIKGEHGSIFKFMSLTQNNDNGLRWVDCIQYEKGIAKAIRSFDIDRIKRIPKRRKHVNWHRINWTLRSNK